MTEIEVISLLKMSEKEITIFLRSLSSTSISKSVKSKFFELTIEQVTKRRFGKAFNLLFAWCQLFSEHEPESVRIIANLVMFPIKNGSDKSLLNFLERLSSNTHLKTRTGWSLKFTSALNYAKIWMAIWNQENMFLEKMRKNEIQLVKCFLANTERRFLTKSMISELKYKFLGAGQYISKESMASASSLLLKRYSERIPLKNKSLDVPLASTNQNDVLDLYFFLSSIETLIDLGVKISQLDFQCISQDDEYHFKSTDTVLNMALSYGYFKNDLSTMNALNYVNDSQPTFKDAANEFVKHFGDKLIKEAGNGILRRIRIEMPQPLLKVLYDEILGKEEYFKDEALVLKSICNEFLTNFTELSNFKITPNLDLISVYHIIRILRFIAYIRDPKLEEFEQSDELAFLNSLILIYAPKESFVEHLISFGIAKNKAEEFIEFFSAEASSPEDNYDIQYQPLLINGKNMFLFPNILSHSNIFRNALVKSKKRFVGGNNKAKLEKILEESVQKWTTKVKLDVEYRFQGIDGEIDLIFELDNTVFVFECKDLLLPCNSFELRSYYEQIKKGINQISKVKEFFHDTKFREVISQKINWKIASSSKIVYGLITGGRIFSGGNMHGFPIRGLRELVNVIECGKIYIGATDEKKEEISVWEGERLTADDLEKYFSPTTIIYAPIWKYCTEEQVKLNFRDVSVSYPDYAFDLVASSRDMGLSDKTIQAIQDQIIKFRK